jgi:filamentous hemagglutinin
LGAPLTTEQIGSLSSDIVWLVDQVVNGEHVLVPVVYLSKSTADQLRSDGALIAGDNVDVKASGTLRNDGTISGTQSTRLSADTLINRGAINGGQQLAIATRGDTINAGTLSGNAIGITAGGSVINAPVLNGMATHGGTIVAGTGGVQIVAAQNVVNQGKIISAGDGLIVAGRDYVQNAAMAGNASHAAPGSLTTAVNAVVIAGRDAVFDQSTISAGKVAYVEAGRDAHFTAATVSGGTGIAVKAGQDIISDTVTDHVASTSYTKQGKNWSSTEVTEDTVRGSSFTSGGDVSMQAGRDVSLTAANVKADGAIGLAAAGDITLATAQSSRTETTDSYTKKGKVKTTTHSETTDAVDVGTTLQAGSGVAMVAGRDINAKAAQIDGGDGAVHMGAGRDINLTVGEASHTEVYDSTSKKSGFWSKAKSSTHTESTDTAVLGTTINGQGVVMLAGQDVHATSAQISANDGAAVVVAGRDMILDTASDTHTYDSTTTSKGAKINSADRGAALAGVPSQLLTRKKTTTTTVHEASTDAVSTTLTGDRVSLVAGRDMTLDAAQIGATHDVTIAAGNNLTVGVATNTYEASQSQTKKKTGLQESGGSVMYGKTKTAQTNSISQSTPEGSLIGSTDGSVTLVAGNALHLTDATVLSNTGTTLAGKNVTIDAAVGSTDITQTQKQSSLGIKAGLSGGVASAAMGTYQSAKRGNEVKDDRLKALYAAQAGYGAYDTYEGAKNIANGTDSTGGASLRIGIGASSASSNTTSHDDTAYGSAIRSNGNVIIAATDGDLNVIGSQISGDNVALAASNAIHLTSQDEDHTLNSRNKNGSGEVGFSIGSQTGWYVSASAGKGDAHGNGTTHATTNVDAANTLSLSSGGDTTLEGAQATGKTVLADIGGSLAITSQQDTNDFANTQTQAGGTFVYGYGGSANFSQGKTNSQYKSVTTVSGIGAGEGGYNIHVGGNTALNGGVIASTADASKNRLDTGSLTYSDIANQAKYSASNIGIGGGNNKATGPIGIAPTVGIPQGDSSHSTTKAGIANGTITVRDGNADLAALDRNPDLAAPGLKPIFDQQKVQERQEMGQVASYVGMRTAGTIADKMYTDAASDLVAARKRGDTAAEADAQARMATWDAGGTNKTILHGVVGAATAALGNGDVLGGAAGAAGSERASGAMHDYLIAHGYEEGSASYNSMMQLGSAAIGGVAGGAGASTALAGDSFNRQLHPNEIKLITGGLAAQYAEEHPGVSVRDAETLLMAQALRQVDDGWTENLGATSSDGLKKMGDRYVQDHADVQQWLADNTPAWAQQAGYFTATAAERADPTINGQYYDGEFHKQWNGFLSDLASGITGADHNTAQDGSQVNFDGYQDMANSLRREGRRMVLEQEVRSGQTLTDAELYEYQRLNMLYPMLEAGALGPFGQLAVAIHDNDPTSAAMAIAGAIPGQGAITGAAQGGKLIGSVEGLTAAEQGFIGEMVAGGRTVEVIPPSTGRTADFLINGQPYELKTMTDVANQTSDGLSKAISSTAMDARGQSGNIIIDARNQPGMTGDIAQRGVERAYGRDNQSGKKIQSITVITSEGSIYVPRVKP